MLKANSGEEGEAQVKETKKKKVKKSKLSVRKKPCAESPECEDDSCLTDVLATDVLAEKEVLPPRDSQGSSGSQGALLPRCGGNYLPERLIRVNQVKEIGFLWTLWYGFTGRWLSISEQSSDSLDAEGMKQAVFDQHVNLAIVSALLLSFMIPLAMEHSGDYLEKGETNSLFNGVIAQLLNKDLGVDAISDWIGTLEDFNYCCYGIAALCNFTAVLLCCFVLLAVIELQTDEAVVSFVKAMGWFYPLPYILWIIGSFLPFLPLTVRSWFMMKSWNSMLLAACICWLQTTIALFFLVRVVRKTVNTILGKTKYTALSLNCEECEEDVCTYLDHVGDEGSLRDCLSHLRCQDANGVVVPLAGFTQMAVRQEYVRQIAKRLQLSEQEMPAWRPMILAS